MKKGLLITAVLALILGMALVSCTQEQGLDLVQVTLNLNETESKSLSQEKADGLAITGYAVTVTPSVGVTNTDHYYSSIGTDVNYFAKDAVPTLTLSKGEWTFEVTAYSDAGFSKDKHSQTFATGSIKQKLNTSAPEVNIYLKPASEAKVLTLTFDAIKVVNSTDLETRVIVRKADNAEVESTLTSGTTSRDGGYDTFSGTATLTGCEDYQEFYIVYQENQKTKNAETNEMEDNWVDTTKKEKLGVNMYDGITMKISGVLTSEEAYPVSTVKINEVTITTGIDVKEGDTTKIVFTASASAGGTVGEVFTWSGLPTGTSSDSNTATFTNAVAKGCYNISCSVPVTIKTSSDPVTVTAFAGASFQWDGSALSKR